MESVTQEPALNDMKLMYELAARIVVIERWQQEHINSDCHMETLSELLDEAEEAFCDFDSALGHETPDLDALRALGDEGQLDRWLDAKTAAVSAFNDFAERFITLTTGRWDAVAQAMFLRDTIESYFKAAKALAVVQQINSGMQSLLEEESEAEAVHGLRQDEARLPVQPRVRNAGRLALTLQGVPLGVRPQFGWARFVAAEGGSPPGEGERHQVHADAGLGEGPIGDSGV